MAIREIQVVKRERPSNWPSLRCTLSNVSCCTSSASSVLRVMRKARRYTLPFEGPINSANMASSRFLISKLARGLRPSHSAVAGLSKRCLPTATEELTSHLNSRGAKLRRVSVNLDAGSEIVHREQAVTSRRSSCNPYTVRLEQEQNKRTRSKLLATSSRRGTIADSRFLQTPCD